MGEKGARERPPDPRVLQILVEVAIIQAHILGSDVEEVSWAIAINPGSGGPDSPVRFSSGFVSPARDWFWGPAGLPLAPACRSPPRLPGGGRCVGVGGTTGRWATLVLTPGDVESRFGGKGKQVNIPVLPSLCHATGRPISFRPPTPQARSQRNISSRCRTWGLRKPLRLE